MPPNSEAIIAQIAGKGKGELRRLGKTAAWGCPHDLRGRRTPRRWQWNRRQPGCPHGLRVRESLCARFGAWRTAVFSQHKDAKALCARLGAQISMACPARMRKSLAKSASRGGQAKLASQLRSTACACAKASARGSARGGRSFFRSIKMRKLLCARLGTRISMACPARMRKSLAKSASRGNQAKLASQLRSTARSASERLHAGTSSAASSGQTAMTSPPLSIRAVPTTSPRATGAVSSL